MGACGNARNWKSGQESWVLASQTKNAKTSQNKNKLKKKKKKKKKKKEKKEGGGGEGRLARGREVRWGYGLY